MATKFEAATLRAPHDSRTSFGTHPCLLLTPDPAPTAQSIDYRQTTRRPRRTHWYGGARLPATQMSVMLLQKQAWPWSRNSRFRNYEGWIGRQLRPVYGY